MPNCFKEIRVEPIRPWGFMRINFAKGNFFISKASGGLLMIKLSSSESTLQYQQDLDQRGSDKMCYLSRISYPKSLTKQSQYLLGHENFHQGQINFFTKNFALLSFSLKILKVLQMNKMVVNFPFQMEKIIYWIEHKQVLYNI